MVCLRSSALGLLYAQGLQRRFAPLHLVRVLGRLALVLPPVLPLQCLYLGPVVLISRQVSLLSPLLSTCRSSQTRSGWRGGGEAALLACGGPMALSTGRASVIGFWSFSLSGWFTPFQSRRLAVMSGFCRTMWLHAPTSSASRGGPAAMVCSLLRDIVSQSWH